MLLTEIWRIYKQNIANSLTNGLFGDIVKGKSAGIGQLFT